MRLQARYLTVVRGQRTILRVLLKSLRHWQFFSCHLCHTVTMVLRMHFLYFLLRRHRHRQRLTRLCTSQRQLRSLRTVRIILRYPLASQAVRLVNVPTLHAILRTRLLEYILHFAAIPLPTSLQYRIFVTHAPPVQRRERTDRRHRHAADTRRFSRHTQRQFLATFCRSENQRRPLRLHFPATTRDPLHVILLFTILFRFTHFLPAFTRHHLRITSS